MGLALSEEQMPQPSFVVPVGVPTESHSRSVEHRSSEEIQSRAATEGRRDSLQDGIGELPHSHARDDDYQVYEGEPWSPEVDGPLPVGNCRQFQAIDGLVSVHGVW